MISSATTQPEQAPENTAGDLVELVAKAIAENAIGVAWPSGLSEVSADYLSQADVRECAKAAVIAIYPEHEDALSNV